MQNPKPQFVHLHVHSHYSLLDSSNTIPKLIQKTQKSQMNAIALTDHGNLFGAIEFYQTARKNKIIPIIGCEFYISILKHTSKSKPPNSKKHYHHLIILAKNIQGYRNISKLASIAYTEGFYYKPRVDKQTLKKHSQGLICLSACLGGEIPQMILNRQETKIIHNTIHEFQEMFGKDSFFLELQNHGIPAQKEVNQKLLEFSKKLNVPLVATNDVHYLNQNDSKAHDILLCIGTQKKPSDQNRKKYYNDQFFLKTPQEMQNCFKDYPSEIFSNTLYIAEMCQNLKLEFTPSIPQFQVPKNHSSDSFLKKISNQGLEKRYQPVTQKIQDRLNYELDMISQMGFSNYFLIVWDFIAHAKKKHIATGPGRGSVAGSIVAYALQITNIDPLKYHLIFERFLNPERTSMPDIDTDFEDSKRDEIIQYVVKQYGKEQVAGIITFGTLKPRAVIRDVARVLDIPLNQVNQIIQLIPSTPGHSLQNTYQNTPELKSLIDQNPLYQKLYHLSIQLEGVNRHASTHAAGIVMSHQNLNSRVPLYSDPKTKSITTQYEGNYLEHCGLIKMDFLGLKNLSVIQKACQIIKHKNPNFHIDSISLNSQKAFQLLKKGKTLGIFQLESSGIQELILQLQPDSIHDIIALIALYRPGPLNSGMTKQFIQHKNHPSKKISYVHPLLQNILKETYGVIVYQEQVMQIAQIIGSLSMNEADQLRKAMGKKNPDMMKKFKISFVNGAKQKNIPPDISQKLYEQMAQFGQYGFNKSHSAAYALITYQTAFLKANYPLQYMASLLSCDMENTDKIAEYIQESRSMNIHILPPCVNQSESEFSINSNHKPLPAIRFALSAIKNVGQNVVQNILNTRKIHGPFQSLKHFCEVVDLKLINKKNLESLIKSGACDSFQTPRNIMLQNIEETLQHAHKIQNDHHIGQFTLFSQSEPQNHSPQNDPEPQNHSPQNHSQNEFLSFEKEVLGFYLSGNPLDQYIQQIKPFTKSLSISHFKTLPDASQISLFAIIQEFETKTSKKGNSWGHCLLEDIHSNSCEALLFGQVLQEYQDTLKSNPCIYIQGKIQKSFSNFKIIADSISNIENAIQKQSKILPLNTPKKIHIQITKNFQNIQELKNLKTLLTHYQGQSEIFLHFNFNNPDNQVTIKVGKQFQASLDDQLISKIKEFPFVENVEWKSNDLFKILE